MNVDASEPTLPSGKMKDSNSTCSGGEEPPRRKPRTQESSLQEICQETVVKNLGRIAESLQCRFSCGGSLPQVKSIKVFFEKKCGRASRLSLPADVANGKRLQEFLDTCSTTSYGMGSQTVSDKAYRDALKLEQKSFATNFILASTTILDSVSTVMTCRKSIRAELYKLNVYCSGGFFKAHVDTPRSSEMFGSLVVSLPSQFEGGALVTRHQGREVRFDWSSSSTTAQWAAFYGDVEHEVLPVTRGHRFTLTYNLYHASPSCHPVSFDISVNPLYKELLAALQMPHFMREGGTLGFFCQYRYVETECEDSGISDCALFLKGEDMVIYQVAKTLGLCVQLKAICQSDLSVNMDDDSHRFNEKYILPTFEYKVCYDLPFDIVSPKQTLHYIFGKGVRDGRHIVWCVRSDEKKAPSCSYLGRRYCGFSYELLYQSAVLLVEVPQYSSGRGTSAS